MRLAILQTSPSLGKLKENIQSATTLLAQKYPSPPSSSNHLDLIVLPELAFSGYNFRTKEDIAPVIESRTDSPSTQWAKEIARKYACKVLVGFPLQVGDERRNTAVLVDSDGTVLHQYQKYHMFDTDYQWGCTSGPGFTNVILDMDGVPTKLSVGICMDLNPWEYTAPFSAYEYAKFILETNVSLILLPMAWLLPKGEDIGSLEPSESTFTYWIQRLHPLINDVNTRTVVVCNRTGQEDDAIYAGTSCVFQIGKGEVVVLGLLGRKEEILEVNVAV